MRVGVVVVEGGVGCLDVWIVVVVAVDGVVPSWSCVVVDVVQYLASEETSSSTCVRCDFMETFFVFCRSPLPSIAVHNCIICYIIV